MWYREVPALSFIFPKGCKVLSLMRGFSVPERVTFFFLKKDYINISQQLYHIQDYSQHFFQMFDSVVIIVSLAIDLIFLNGLGKAQGEEAAALLVVFLLWRIVRVINGISVIPHMKCDFLPSKWMVHFNPSALHESCNSHMSVEDVYIIWGIYCHYQNTPFFKRDIQIPNWFLLVALGQGQWPRVTVYGWVQTCTQMRVHFC